MKRSWLIAGVIAAGILVFWLAGDDKPTPSKRAATAPTPIDSYYAAGEASSDTEPAPEAAVPQWRGYSVYSPAPVGGYNYRPLTDWEKSRQQASGTRAFRSQSQGVAGGTPFSTQPAVDAKVYSAPPGTSGYKFRPIDSVERGTRYTGDFPRPPEPTLSGPMWPGTPEIQGQPRSPWNDGPPTPYGPGSLWAYRVGPP